MHVNQFVRNIYWKRIGANQSLRVNYENLNLFAAKGTREHIVIYIEI